MPRKPENIKGGWVVSVSAVLCVISVLVLVHEYIRLRATGREFAQVRDDNQSNTRQLARLQESSASHLNEASRLQAAIATNRPARTKEDALAAGRLFIADHPESRDLVRRMMEGLAASWPARAGRAAGFSKEQNEQWQAIFARQKEGPFVREEGVTPIFGDLENVQEAGLKAIVGVELYTKYQEVMASSYGRFVAAEIAEHAEAAGQSLTAEQVQRLATLFGKSNLNEPSAWDRIDPQVAALLSPEQKRIFDEEGAPRRAEDSRSNYTRALLGKNSPQN